MAKQIWQSTDGSNHNTKEAAEIQDLVVEAANLLVARAEAHDINVDSDDVLIAAQILVQTDAFAQLQVLLKGKL